MDDENSGLTDLWGDPWTPPKEKRGRPRHKRDPQVAEKIAVLKASGLTTEQVSVRIGLSEPTLRKIYFRELTDGATLVQAVLNEAMWEKAKSGVIGAARYMREEMEKGDARRIGRPDRPLAPPEKEAPMGKKAERQAAAQSVGGRFAIPQAPTLVVDNK